MPDSPKLPSIPLTLELIAGDYRLVLAPALGGTISDFEWREEALFRSTCGPSVLDTACFPLVPFSNRIAFGQFEFGGRKVTLTPNFPGLDNPHPLHGFGWLSAWDVVRASPRRAVISHRHAGGEWPWAYAAEQEFLLAGSGFRHILRVKNLSDEIMPAGLGFHPYFPRTPHSTYRGLHCGEWQNSPDGLPLGSLQHDRAVDWWQDRPIDTRAVDTVYTGRDGPLQIGWPERRLALGIKPCDDLPFTVVFTPQEADFFCVEPVSHATGALNRPDGGGMWRLRPGQTRSVHVDYTAFVLKQTAAGQPAESRPPRLLPRTT